MWLSNRTTIALSVLAAAAALAAGCVDERIVFRDRELFTEPPTGSADFLGYTDEASKLTVCGNCHVEKQGQWEQTKHASAWEDLQASGHATEACEECHTVNANGNLATGLAGWTATKDTRYHDVQCESCHGAGMNHVENPKSGNVPLAAMVVDTALTKGCGECHTGTHHPFVEEWRQSAHAHVQDHAAGNPECETCHVGEGVLEAWGIRSNYLEKDSLLNTPGASMPNVCGVCHDPHQKNFEGQLRYAVDATTPDLNLCMRCHNRRSSPDPSSSRGPHAPEGPTLLGEAGWFPPNFEYAPGTIVATHGSDQNPRLCATCHVGSYQVTDPATGAFVFQASGHLFEAIPCLDSQGVPTTGSCDLSQRTFKSCAATGCHTEVSARSAYITAEGRIDLLSETLINLIDKVPASEFSTTDNRYTTGEGAKFNYDLAQIPGTKFHNPFLIEALLSASIKQIKTDYGITAPPGLVLDNLLTRPAHN
jgi:predicted CXXCH cytochrome family protein